MVVGCVIVLLGLEGEDQPVEGQIEESLWVVLNRSLLHRGERGVATVGKRGLGIAVLGLAARHVVAGWPTGFGERVADQQAAGAVKPIGGLFCAEAAVQQDCSDRLDERERGFGDRRTRAEQDHRVRVGQERCARFHDDRAQVVLPIAGGVGDPVSARTRSISPSNSAALSGTWW